LNTVQALLLSLIDATLVSILIQLLIRMQNDTELLPVLHVSTKIL
jgi:hypothetical protein